LSLVLVERKLQHAPPIYARPLGHFIVLSGLRSVWISTKDHIVWFDVWRCTNCEKEWEVPFRDTFPKLASPCRPRTKHP
jgi:hypothetical protein